MNDSETENQGGEEKDFLCLFKYNCGAGGGAPSYDDEDGYEPLDRPEDYGS